MTNRNLTSLSTNLKSMNAPNKEHMHDIRNSIKHIGPYFNNSQHLEQYGQLIDVRYSNAEMNQFRRAIPRIQNRRIDQSTDNEAVDAIQKYFWGQQNGIVLELGGADGNEASESLPLMSHLGWHRVLIEGSPIYTKNIAQRAPDALSIHCAICAQEGIVHYASRGLTSGILEFMEPTFLTTFYPDLKNVTNNNQIVHRNSWKNYTQFVTPIHCYPLSKILHYANLTHINYFILDTEGSELEILKTISWDQIRFDIVTIETEKSLRSPWYAENITAYMFERGYVHLMNKGRNSWYKHRNYEVSSAPMYDFMGHIYDAFITPSDYDTLTSIRTSEQMVYVLFDCCTLVLFFFFLWRIVCRQKRLAKGT